MLSYALGLLVLFETVICGEARTGLLLTDASILGHSLYVSDESDLKPLWNTYFCLVNKTQKIKALTKIILFLHILATINDNNQYLLLLIFKVEMCRYRLFLHNILLGKLH